MDGVQSCVSLTLTVCYVDEKQTEVVIIRKDEIAACRSCQYDAKARQILSFLARVLQCSRKASGNRRKLRPLVIALFFSDSFAHNTHNKVILRADS